MGRSHKASAIILRRNDYADADRIYTVLTQDSKRSLIAKSIRKSGAKLASHMELFSEIDLMYIEGGGSLDILTSARTLCSWSLSDDYERMRRGFLFLEMIDKMTDTEEIGELYGLLRDSLGFLEVHTPLLCELYFKLNLLKLLGHAPDMSSSSEYRNYGFDTEHGVLVDGGKTTSVAMSKDQIKLWRLMLSREFETVVRIKAVEPAARTTLGICDEFIVRQFGLRFRSAEM